MNKIFSSIVFVILFAMSNAQPELSKSTILKDSTVLTYEFIKLNRQIGFGGEKIVEGNPQDDLMEIILVKTDNGFQLFDKTNDGKFSKSNIFLNKNQDTAEVYVSPMEGPISIDNKSTLYLSKKQFYSPVISAITESDEVIYKYVKTDTKKFSLMINGEKVDSKAVFYNTKKDNETLVKTIGFLELEDLPIQTHHYYIVDYEPFNAFAFRLVSINTKK